MTSPQRFPDLTGKAVIAVGSSALLVEIVDQLAVNRMLIAVVAPDRDLVAAAVAAAEERGAMVNGFTVDPADPAVWERIRPHIEQRLGPIDVAICEGDLASRVAMVNALLPDMAARKRGVIIEVGPGIPESLAVGVRHHVVPAAGPTASAVAAQTLRCASDRPDQAM